MSKRFRNGVLASLLSLAMWAVLAQGSMSAYSAFTKPVSSSSMVARLE